MTKKTAATTAKNRPLNRDQYPPKLVSLVIGAGAGRRLILRMFWAAGPQSLPMCER